MIYIISILIHIVLAVLSRPLHYSLPVDEGLFRNHLEKKNSSSKIKHFDNMQDDNLAVFTGGSLLLSYFLCVWRCS